MFRERVMDLEEESNEEASGPAPANTFDAIGEEWEFARALVGSMRPPPANLVAVVRQMTKAGGAFDLANARVGPGFELRRFLKSNTVQSHYFFAAKAYRPEILQQPALDSYEPFIMGFTPMDHSALLALVCLFKSFLRRSDKDEWGYIQEPLYDALTVGAALGSAIPAIGLGRGLLTRGVRYLAFAPFLWSTKKGFQEYRRHLKKHDLAFDPVWEKKVWGCTTLEISTLCLQMLGFNSGVSEDYFRGLSPRDVLSEKPASQGEIAFRAAHGWMEYLMDGTDLPANISGEFARSAADAAQLRAAVADLAQEPNRVEWLNKGRGSLTHETAPELCPAPTP
jgi:hypothetical protein